MSIRDTDRTPEEMRDKIFYTIVDAVSGYEHRVEIEYDKFGGNGAEPPVINFPPLPSVSMDPQQLAELGHLLIALSRHNYDKDSIIELIAGYNDGNDGERLILIVNQQLGKGKKMVDSAFEITAEDVQTVAQSHGVELSEEEAQQLCDELDHHAIVKGLLTYVDMDDQITSCYDDIENVVLEKGIITGDKVYVEPPEV